MSGSVLPPEVHSALAQLLAGLQSPDNVQRVSGLALNPTGISY